MQEAAMSKPKPPRAHQKEPAAKVKRAPPPPAEGGTVTSYEPAWHAGVRGLDVDKITVTIQRRAREPAMAAIVDRATDAAPTTDISPAMAAIVDPATDFAWAAKGETWPARGDSDFEWDPLFELPADGMSHNLAAMDQRP